MDPVSFIVVTLNVLQVGHQPDLRYPAIDTELAALAPDVVLLQEVRRLTPSSTSADRLLRAYPHRAVDGRTGAYHLAILSRHPIRRVVRVPYGNNRARMAFGAVIDVRGTDVLVVTTHLDWQLDHHTQRSEQLAALFAETARFAGPVVVTGDFNFGDSEPESSAIPKAFTDAWSTLHPGEPGFTWSVEDNPMAAAGRLPGEPSRRLDRILSRGLTPVESRVVFTRPVRGKLFPSDHFGVLARLRLP